MAKVDSYKLAHAFESAVVLSMVGRPKFYSTIGYAVEPEALDDKHHTLIVKAVREIVKDTAHAPSHSLIVIQRVRRWVDDGKVTEEELDGVIDVFMDAAALPPEAEVLGELVPIIQRRMEAAAIRMAMETYARKGDFVEVQKILHKASSLGNVDTNTGLRLGTGVFAEIEHLRTMERLGTGIDELDIGLGGGLPKGCLGLFAAPPGGGKSMFLNHVCAHAVKMGYFCVVATLEINRAAWMARVMSNLTGEPIDKIMSSDITETRRKIEAMYPLLGTLIVKDFPAKLTSMRDITGWVDECTEEEGHRPHLLVVDYADKCKSHLIDDQRKGEYESQGTIYETLRLYAFERAMWAWTASQPRRAAGKEKRRRIELDDLAESNKKAMVVDLMVTGTKDAEGEMIEYVVPKFRYGKSDFAVGPLPHDWACGRMVAIP